jgi:hypothetical protein
MLFSCGDRPWRLILGTKHSRVYEVSESCFAQWPSVIATPLLFVEVESEGHIYRTVRGRIDYPPGRVKADGGQVFVFPAKFLLPGTEQSVRSVLCIAPGPADAGARPEPRLDLVERVGSLFEAAGARLLSHAEVKALVRNAGRARN